MRPPGGPRQAALSLTVGQITLIESVELVLVCLAESPPLSHHHPVYNFILLSEYFDLS